MEAVMAKTSADRTEARRQTKLRQRARQIQDLRRAENARDAMRDALGDLIDTLSDEMQFEVAKSVPVIEQIERSALLLGGNYLGYIGTWL